jgi:hypothetical protein
MIALADPIDDRRSRRGVIGCGCSPASVGNPSRPSPWRSSTATCRGFSISYFGGVIGSSRDDLVPDPGVAELAVLLISNSIPGSASSQHI